MGISICRPPRDRAAGRDLATISRRTSCWGEGGEGGEGQVGGGNVWGRWGAALCECVCVCVCAVGLGLWGTGRAAVGAGVVGRARYEAALDFRAPG